MSKKREGKIALVTGGSRGIGAAIAKRLAADGANLAITYTKGADAAASVIKEIERAGGKAIAIKADAADADAVKAAVEKTFATFGRLDVLVNNAGTAIPNAFEESTVEEMDRVLDINVRGVFVATHAALKHMNEGGRIIMIGSAVGEPGPIDTELNPASGDWAVPQKAATAIDRYGRVDEIAAMVAFVAGPESWYITGANLTVDGGMNA
jgi:3-oxoacyl-[acyl-carrier protein] reductase